MNKNNKYFCNFGYKYFGPLIYNFVIWLLNDLKRNKIEKVYFLSRDGYIIKKAFDIINLTNIKSYYFYASRRSIIVPYLWKLKSEKEIFDVISFNKKITIETFLKKVGLDNYDVSSFLKKYNFTLHDYVDISNRGIFDELLKEVFPIIKSNSKSEWHSMIKYIEDNDFNGRVAIVDIGWYGSMQNSLEKLLPNVEIYGYYFGLIPNKVMSIKNAKGYLFDKGKNIEIYNKLHYFINIFEFLFLAQHGSVKRYSNNDCGVEFYEYEYSKCDEKYYVKFIQDSAIKFVKDNFKLNIEVNDAIDKFIFFFINPNYKTSKIFGNIKFNDDEFKYIAKPSSLLRYIFDIKKFKHDFINSSWRIGFLKRLFIIPLPYFKINNLIRKIYLDDK